MSFSNLFTFTCLLIIIFQNKTAFSSPPQDKTVPKRIQNLTKKILDSSKIPELYLRKIKKNHINMPNPEILAKALNDIFSESYSKWPNFMQERCILAKNEAHALMQMLAQHPKTKTYYSKVIHSLNLCYKKRPQSNIIKTLINIERHLYPQYGRKYLAKLASLYMESGSFGEAVRLLETLLQTEIGTNKKSKKQKAAFSLKLLFLYFKMKDKKRFEQLYKKLLKKTPDSILKYKPLLKHWEQQLQKTPPKNKKNYHTEVKTYKNLLILKIKKKNSPPMEVKIPLLKKGTTYGGEIIIHSMRPDELVLSYVSKTTPTLTHNKIHQMRIFRRKRTRYFLNTLILSPSEKKVILHSEFNNIYRYSLSKLITSSMIRSWPTKDMYDIQNAIALDIIQKTKNWSRADDVAFDWLRENGKIEHIQFLLQQWKNALDLKKKGLSTLSKRINILSALAKLGLNNNEPLIKKNCFNMLDLMIKRFFKEITFRLLLSEALKDKPKNLIGRDLPDIVQEFIAKYADFQMQKRLFKLLKKSKGNSDKYIRLARILNLSLLKNPTKIKKEFQKDLLSVFNQAWLKPKALNEHTVMHYRSAILLMLGAFRDKTFFPFFKSILKKALNNPNPYDMNTWVQVSTIIDGILTRFREEATEFLPIIEKLLFLKPHLTGQGKMMASMYIAYALKHFGPKSLPIHLKALQHPNRDVRLAAGSGIYTLIERNQIKPNQKIIHRLISSIQKYPTRSSGGLERPPTDVLARASLFNLKLFKKTLQEIKKKLPIKEQAVFLGEISNKYLRASKKQSKRWAPIVKFLLEKKLKTEQNPKLKKQLMRLLKIQSSKNKK